MSERPTIEAALAAIESFLRETFGDAFGRLPDFELIEDGDYCWAFWVLDDDTTSYLHSDLSVEWYGTSWEDEAR